MINFAIPFNNCFRPQYHIYENHHNAVGICCLSLKRDHAIMNHNIFFSIQAASTFQQYLLLYFKFTIIIVVYGKYGKN